MKYFFCCILFLQFFQGNTQNCIPFKLSRNGSALYWPFGVGSPLDPKGWGSHGYAYGQLTHTGSDYYAIDWSSIEFPVCDSPFYAPLSGKVVSVNGGCPTLCVGSRSQCGDYGNQIIIRSNVNPDFYFRVAHLARVFVQRNDTIQPRQLIGTVGSTGNSTGPHAHCVLYYVPDSNLTALSTGGGPDSHAVVYNFYSTCGISLITSVNDVLEKEKIKIYSNPVQNYLWIEVNNPGLVKLDWTLYDVQGRQFKQGQYFRNKPIDMTSASAGVYFLKLISIKFDITVKIIKM